MDRVLPFTSRTEAFADLAEMKHVPCCQVDGYKIAVRRGAGRGEWSSAAVRGFGVLGTIEWKLDPSLSEINHCYSLSSG